MEIVIKKVETISEFIDAIRLRVDVFIREQWFQPGWEPDEDDKKSRHFIAMISNSGVSKIVSTARYRETEPDVIKIERMVTEKGFREKGIGKKLIEFMIEEIKKENPQKIWLRSQVRSKGFYEKCGFKTISDPFDMFGVEHIDLELKE